jgi:hypothetical protein
MVVVVVTRQTKIETGTRPSSESITRLAPPPPVAGKAEADQGDGRHGEMKDETIRQKGG